MSVKLLIRARWKDDPGFLSDRALEGCDLLKIIDDRNLDNRFPSWRLPEEAAVGHARFGVVDRSHFCER